MKRVQGGCVQGPPGLFSVTVFPSNTSHPQLETENGGGDRAQGLRGSSRLGSSRLTCACALAVSATILLPIVSFFLSLTNH